MLPSLPQVDICNREKRGCLTAAVQRPHLTGLLREGLSQLDEHVFSRILVGVDVDAGDPLVNAKTDKEKQLISSSQSELCVGVFFLHAGVNRVHTEP